MERLEEELTCAVCCGIFRDPRVLPCSHTFCRECLQGVLQLSPLSRLRCPSCRAVLDLPAPTALQALPTSFALRAVIEKWQQREEPRAEGTCPEHPRQPLNIYCLLDRQGVCGLCLTSGRHRGHPIADPQRAAGRLRGQLTDGHWRDVQLCHTRLTMQKSQCEELLRGEREVVVQYFSKLGETLERKKEALLRALEELNRRFLEEHEPLVEEISKMKVEEIELKYLSASVRKEKSPLLCLEKLEKLQQRIKALQQKELPDVRPLEIYPRMEDLLRNVWSKTEVGQIHKILPPKLKLIPRRKSCSKCPGKENRDSKEQLWAVKLLPALLLLLGVAGGVFCLHKALSAGVIQAAPAWGMEFLLQVYQNSCTLVQRAVDGLCHTFTSLMGLCRGIVPF
ncbi:TRI59 protein, partial [Sakesphorus luctuosus]|nr:TRI59 protein [Sakesphorus luctuosus]